MTQKRTVTQRRRPAREGEITVKGKVAKPNGRIPKIKDAITTPLLNALRLGNPIATALKFSEITDTTLDNWLAKGKAARDKPAAQITSNDRLYLKFLGEFEKAVVEANVRAQAQIHSIYTIPIRDNEGNVLASPEQQRVVLTAAKTQLEHRDPSFKSASMLELTGADGGPLALDVDAAALFAKIVAIADDEEGEDDE